MESSIQKFNCQEFGEIRTLREADGKVLFCGKDIAEALGYTNSRKALSDHCKGVTKRYTLTEGGKQELSFIPEGDVYRLICNSKLSSAEKFELWVFDEVLPAIRKTGGYASPALDKKLAIMDKNADARLAHAMTQKAKVMLDMMKSFKDSMTQTSRQVFMAKCGELLSGQDLSELLPKATRKLYSAAQVGEMFGLSAKAVGHIANENSLKAPEGQVNKFGEWKCSKSKYSSKEVPMWFYSDEAVEWFRHYCRSTSHE